jgi:hypothetical protein
MSTYWVTFRISKKTFNHKTNEDRYKALQEAVRTSTTKWWVDPENFYVFESERDIESLAESFKLAIDPTHDLFLIRDMNAGSAVIYGKTEDHDIFTLMPYLKRL